MEAQREKRNLPACRVFFKELLKSNFFVNAGGWDILVTPSCARCNRLFGVGEVKEVEKRGNITKIKISDTTATFNIYTDKVIQLDSEVFLAFIGNLHVRANKGRGFLITVEEAGQVEEDVRNAWIIKTAKRTMERIELLRNLTLRNNDLSNGGELPGNALMEAMQHYAIDDDKRNVLADMAINAVKGVWQYYSKTTKEMVLDALKAADKGRMERMKITSELENRGLAEEWIEEVIEELIAEGRCYEPEEGLLKVV